MNNTSKFELQYDFYYQLEPKDKLDKMPGNYDKVMKRFAKLTTSKEPITFEKFKENRELALVELFSKLQ
jgi:hypothetical protein